MTTIDLQTAITNYSQSWNIQLFEGSSTPKAQAQTSTATETRSSAVDLSSPAVILDLSTKSRAETPPAPKQSESASRPLPKNVEIRIAEAARDLAKVRSSETAKTSSNTQTQLTSNASFAPIRKTDGDFVVEPISADIPTGVFTEASSTQLQALLTSYFSGRSMEFFKVYRQIAYSN